MSEFALTGVINVNKKPGFTSHDVVAIARKALGIKQVGHAGTLDPAARGVLPLLFGRVTRLARFFGDYEKSYVATVKLGAETDTGDDEGKVLYRRTVPSDAYGSLAAVAASFVGEINQEVPPYSAVKVGGEPLYRRARRGEDVAVPTRRVTVYALDVIKVEAPTFTMTVKCGGGTYIRAIARDIGRKLGVGAYLVGLVRTAVGPYPIERSLEQDRLAEGREVVLAPPHFTPAAALLTHITAIAVSPAAAVDFAHGRAVNASGWLKPGANVRVMDAAEQLLGIGVAVGNLVKPDTVLVTPEEMKSHG